MPLRFTADTHFDHARAIKWSKRPFASPEEMNEVMIKNWNSVVSDQDTIYHLGDFFFHAKSKTIDPILSRLNGTIHLVCGNHDLSPPISRYAKDRIASYSNYLEITVDNQLIVLCHYPLAEWNDSFRGSWHLHGHAHNSWPQTKWKRLDVGVDGNNYTPWTFNKIKKLMKSRAVMDRSIYST